MAAVTRTREIQLSDLHPTPPVNTVLDPNGRLRTLGNIRSVAEDSGYDARELMIKGALKVAFAVALLVLGILSFSTGVGTLATVSGFLLLFDGMRDIYKGFVGRNRSIIEDAYVQRGIEVCTGQDKKKNNGQQSEVQELRQQVQGDIADLRDRVQGFIQSQSRTPDARPVDLGHGDAPTEEVEVV